MSDTLCSELYGIIVSVLCANYTEKTNDSDGEKSAKVISTKRKQNERSKNTTRKK